MKGAPSAQDIVSAIGNIATALKRQEARQKAKAKQDQALRKTLTEEDLRLAGDAMSTLASSINEQGEMDV